MNIEKKVETFPEREARLKESGVQLVRSILDSYQKKATEVVEYPSILPDGVRILARKQLNAVASVLDPDETLIEAHPYLPYANATGLDASWTQKVFGYEVFFCSLDHDTEPVSSGLYIDLEGYVHIKVGDGWSSVYGNNQDTPALENQVMKDMFMGHILTVVDQAGPAFSNVQYPYMVSV